MKYGMAELQFVTKSFQAFMRSYTPCREDEELEDPVTWCTQAELFESVDADDVAAKTLTLTDIAPKIPLVCRTLDVDWVASRKTNLCLWSISLISLPTVLKYTNTQDYLRRFKDQKNDKEFISGAVIVTRRKDSILDYGVGKYLSSYLLCGNGTTFFHDAVQASWSVIAIHIISQPTRMAWMEDELDLIRLMNSNLKLTSWKRYLSLVESDAFKLALITSSPDLPVHVQCPHVNKFVFATFLCKEKLSVLEIAIRRESAVIELSGRMQSKVPISRFFEQRLCRSMLEQLPFKLYPTLEETVQRFRFCACGMPASCIPVDLDNVPKEIQENYQNTSIQKVLTAFQGMCPELPPVDKSDLFKMFLLGYVTPDSMARSKLYLHDYDAHRVSSVLRMRFKNNLIAASDSFATAKYLEAISHVHDEFPVYMGAENMRMFKEKHGRDLREEFAVNEHGISANTCLCRACPFFNVKLGSVDASTGINRRLMSHIDCKKNWLPYILVTSSFVHHNDKIADESVKRFMKSMSVQKFLNVLRGTFEQTELEWEDFEALFIQ